VPPPTDAPSPESDMYYSCEFLSCNIVEQEFHSVNPVFHELGDFI
jgi:hypothetical protein